MSKYIAVAKIHFKAQLAYRFEVMMTALSTIWRVVFAWILWGAIFAARDEVGGFTHQAMLSYYLISSFFATMDVSGGVSGGMCGEICGRIKDGTFSKFMVIPSNPQLHFLSQTLGSSAYYGLFALLAAVVSAFIFRINPSITTDPAAILLAVSMFLLGIVFMNGYQFFLGIWAFKLQDTLFLTHLLTDVVYFLKGEMIPLSLLPAVFERALRFLPFTHTLYTPAMLLIGKLDVYEGLLRFTVLAVWTFGIMVVSQIVYGRLRRKYEGVGI